MIDLHTVHTVAPVTVKKHPFAFGIVTSKRTFFAKANSQDEMDDWVRAINSVRRKLSEMQEEERNKREAGKGMTIPTIPTTREPDPTIGTFGSGFSSATGGSISSSPVANAGYFAPRSAQATASSPGAASSSSPVLKTNTLTSAMAKMSVTKPSNIGTTQSTTHPRLPSAPPTASPWTRNMLNTPGPRKTSAEYFPTTNSGISVPPPNSASAMMISSDEDEGYLSDAPTAFPNLGSTSGQGDQGGYSPVDPNKVILSAYLMKRSKGRGRRLWRKRWFYLTSQGLTYAKSHMVSLSRCDGTASCSLLAVYFLLHLLTPHRHIHPSSFFSASLTMLRSYLHLCILSYFCSYLCDFLLISIFTHYCLPQIVPCLLILAGADI